MDCVFQAAERAGSRKRMFDADAMLAHVLAGARRTDFSDRSFVEPLRRLLDSCEREADLSAFGRYGFRLDVMRSLGNLLRFDAAEDADPALKHRAVESPLFVTGLPRSGTTFLHTLLAQDPENAVPRAWQLMYPYPQRLPLVGTDLRRYHVGLQLRLFRLISPEIDDLHPLSADAPQECTDITAQVFQSLRFDSTYRVPSYQAWIRDYGHTAAYRFHRRFLAHLDAQDPGRRWVLKSPDHVFALDAIEEVYPDAQFVFLHRDPADVLASVLKLTEVLRRPFAHGIDREEIGEEVSAYWLEGAHRMLDAARAGKGNILHLRYDDLVRAPMDAVAGIYRHCGRVLCREARGRMGVWLEAQHRLPRRRRRYSLAEFGLDAAGLRMRFARYIADFGLASGPSFTPVELARQHAA